MSEVVSQRRASLDPAQLGLWAFLGTVTMLFAAFGSAYIVRRASADWVPVQLPATLILSTAVLLASSISLALAERAVATRESVARRYLALTLLLGIVFVGCQMFAWRQLAVQGVFVPTSPHSSFFYLLTGVHILHVAGGIAMLSWAMAKAGGQSKATTHVRRLRLCSTYWHFLAGVWVLLLLGMKWG